MGLEFFIRRPIFATVCALIIVLAGSISIPILPLSQYPDVAPPRVSVTANYIGANAQVVESAVTTILEQQINGIQQGKYITSASGNDGTSSINITFDLERDVDLAAVDVQSRIARAEGRLPDEVRRTGVSVEKVSSAFLLAIGMSAPAEKYSTQFLSNYTDVYIKDALKRVNGVGDVIIFGERKYCMRIWLDPRKMAQKQITTRDIVDAIREQNVQVAAGQIGQPPNESSQMYQMSVRVVGRLKSAAEFENLIIRTGKDGTIIHLSDVGRAELGAEDYQTVVRYRGHETVGIGIMQRPGSNAIETVKGIRAEMARLAKKFPPGIQYEYAFDTTLAVDESIREVLFTLIQAIGLVVLTIFVFLQNWRSTLIPVFTIPVSLIGTFACMKMLGFSINTLTLFGLVLATGLVVDDAIVVIENISRLMAARGLSAFNAAREAMREVASAVVAISLVLVAVFVPVAFFPGTTGQLYKQFALTIACSVSISAFTALTLTPALSALWLKSKRRRDDDAATGSIGSGAHGTENGGSGTSGNGGNGGAGTRSNSAYGAEPAGIHSVGDGTHSVGDDLDHGHADSHWIFKPFNKMLDWVREGYRITLVWTLRLKPIALILFAATLAATWWLFQVVPSSFIPDEDKGYFMTIVQGPEGTSLNYTIDTIKKVEKILDGIPEIHSTFGVAGFSFAGNKPSNGILFSNLHPWHDRRGKDQSLDAIINKVRGPLMGISEARVIPFNPPAIEGLSNFGGFIFEILDFNGTNITDLEKATNDLCAKANQTPGLTGVFSGFAANSPQIQVEVDRDKAKTLNVRLSDIFDTLQTYIGSFYVNDIDIGTRVYRVYVQADAQFRSNPSDIIKYYVISTTGQMVPLSNLVKLKEITAPQSINHYNLFRATEINGSAAPGFSSGQAMAAMEKLADSILPSTMSYRWSGISLEETESGSQALILFALGITFVFLVLAAQYESFTDPAIILITVPTALFGAILAQYARGLQNDVFCQIGLVMLIGLVCKNAILIVEFANQLKKEGMPPSEAVVKGATIRLRPILMTTFAFVMGILPLVFAQGAGANSRHSLGTAVCGGMVVSSILSLYIVPVVYVMKDQIAQMFRSKRKETADYLIQCHDVKTTKMD